VVTETSTSEATSDAAATEGIDRHLTLEQAVEAHTSVAAWSSFDEQRKGRLARGLLADIVILNTDVFTPGRRLSDAEVDTTIFDGKVVYSRAALLGTH
jgi:predicted amidohydrolase YtcJ